MHNLPEPTNEQLKHSGNQLLAQALQHNAEIRLNAEKAGCYSGSSINGGNPYGNSIGHAKNALGIFMGLDEIPVYRGFSKSTQTEEPTVEPLTHDQLEDVKKNPVFLNKPEELVVRCIARLEELRKEERDIDEFEHAGIGLLNWYGFV